MSTLTARRPATTTSSRALTNAGRTMRRTGWGKNISISSSGEREGRMGTMTKRFEAAVAQVRELPEAEQDEIAEVLFELLSIDEADYALTPEQVTEVKRRQADLQSGNSRLATDEEMETLWKKCGL